MERRSIEGIWKLEKNNLLALMLKFPNFTKLFEIHTNARDFTIEGVFMQEGYIITFENKKLCRTQLWWPNHKKQLSYGMLPKNAITLFGDA
jgi:hypothetical protein